jgi:O-antigen ligase
MAVGILTHVVHRRQGFLVIAMAITALVAVGFVQSARSSDAVERDLEAGIYSELTAKGTNDTRGHLWAARLEEYMSSPVIGVGFQQQRIYRKDTDENFLEPGSSYLAVLSMTGTVGLIGFVWLVVSLFSSLFTSTSAVPTAYQDLLRGWTAFFAVHLIIEGYIFACGSLLCFLFWLTAGCSMSLHSLGRRKQMRDRTIVQMRAMQTLRKQAAA